MIYDSFNYQFCFESHTTYEFIGTREQFNNLTTLLNSDDYVRTQYIVDIGYADMLIRVDETGVFNLKEYVGYQYCDLLVEVN
jgi:hypothetical protein